MFEYNTVKELLNICRENGLELWQIILKNDATEKLVSEDVIFEKMRSMYQAMKEADSNYNKDLKSQSNMAGADGEKLHKYNQAGKNICGNYMGLAMEKAIKMGESNACMKRIVAAPTAGSCGVIPAVLISYEEEFHMFEDVMIKALLISAGFGKIIATNASISGAFGGCQAEIGSASAMAAAGLTFLQGGTNEQIANACALALKNMLGLACDPVCGLVEVPCIKRNSAGAVNAIASSQLAMAGIKSVIPPDEVIDSMQRIGNALPACLKETSEGGLATTETAIKIHNSLNSY